MLLLVILLKISMQPLGGARWRAHKKSVRLFGILRLLSRGSGKPIRKRINIQHPHAKRGTLLNSSCTYFLKFTRFRNTRRSTTCS